jgi:hypothetical protein
MKIKTIGATEKTTDRNVFIVVGLNKAKDIIAFANRTVLLQFLTDKKGLIYIHKIKRPQELASYHKLARELKAFPVLQVTIVPPGATLITHNESYMIYKLQIIKKL